MVFAGLSELKLQCGLDEAGRHRIDNLIGRVKYSTSKEIGARTGISESSVKAALQQLFRKAGARTRSQLVRIALEEYRTR
jgi:FixJ family two-component response regulator